MIEIKNLITTYTTLVECHNDYIQNPNSKFLQYIADSCVKRFEYTLETAWKLMKKIFIKKYGKTEQELTINNIFRLMQGYGYTTSWESWRDYYQKRNNTAHEYNLVKSRELISLIPEFIKDVDFLIEQLKKEDLNEY